MNSKKLLRNFEFSKSQDGKNFSTAVVDIEEERRGPCPSSVFFHTLLITRVKTAWNVNLIIHLMNTCMVIAYWMMLPALSPDKEESSVIFGSEKDQ